MQQHGHCSADIPEFQEGEGTDEEVNGHGQSGICLNQDSNEQVSCQSEEVDAFLGVCKSERVQDACGRETGKDENLGVHTWLT